LARQHDCNAEQETGPIHLKLLLQSFSRAQALKQSLDLDQDTEDGRALHRAVQTALERTNMSGPKFEVPGELRNLAERTIEQAEKAFDMFFEAANKSMASLSHPGAEISKKALSLTEQNMRFAFDAARKLAQATDLQEAMQIQSEFMKGQITNAGQQMKQIAEGIVSTTKDVTEGRIKVGGST
jgi:phasin